MVRLFNAHAPARFLAYPEALDPILARAGTRVAPGLVACARDPALRLRAMRMLLHLGTPRAVPVMLDAFARLPSLQRLARRWLVRFAGDALALLVPLACGADAERLDLVLVQKPADAMVAARAALRFLARAGAREEVLEVARAHRLDEAVAEALSEDELHGKRPVIPWPVKDVPPPRWKSGKALTRVPFERFVSWLALVDWDYPDLLDARETLDEASLDDTACALFSAWTGSGAIAAGRWVTVAAAELGGPRTQRELLDTLRHWKAAYRTPAKDVLGGLAAVAVRNYGHPRADRALALLAEIDVKGSSRSQERYAREAITWVEEELEGESELQDRLIPTLGFDAPTSTRFDYGRRSFRIELDPTLRLVVRDEEGARASALPTARKSDDTAKVKEAKTRFAALSKDARALASSLTARMQRALREQKRWHATTFEQLVVRHVVLGSVARGLVWAAYDAGGTLIATFRVCEDHTFADVDDRRFVLPPDATLSVAHPAAIDEQTWARWATLLAENEIIQPFGQLAWPVVRLTEDDRRATEMPTVRGTRHTIRALRERGWTAGAEDIFTWEKVLARGYRAMIFYKPNPAKPYAPDVVVDSLRLQRIEELGWERFEPFGALDPVTASELLLEVRDEPPRG
jgi:hypothetical protein